MRILEFLFRPGMKKNDSDYMDFLARLAGLKILSRFEDTGLRFLAQAELRSGRKRQKTKQNKKT